MPVTVGDLVAKLSADISGFTRGLAEAQRQLGAFEATTKVVGDRAVDNIERAWATLGVKSKTQTDIAKREIVSAYAAIRDSGTATAEELAVAHEKMNKSLKALTDEGIGGAKKGVSGLIGQISNLKNAFESGRGGAGLLSVATAALSNAWVAAAIAAGTLLYAGHKLIGAFKEEMKTVKELTAISGLSASTASDLSSVIVALGEDASTAQVAFFRLSSELTQGAESLNKLGIEIHNVSGVLKTEGELFFELRNTIAGLGTQSERTAALIDLFGARLGRRLSIMFSKSREEFDALMARMAELSPTTDKMVEANRELEKSQGELTAAWAGASNTLAVTIVPAYIFANKVMTESLALTTKLLEVREREAALAGQQVRSIFSFIGRITGQTRPMEEYGPPAPQGPQDFIGPRNPLSTRALRPSEVAAQMATIDAELARVNQEIELTLAREQQAVVTGASTQAKLTATTIAEIDKRVKADADATEKKKLLARGSALATAEAGEKLDTELRKLDAAHAAVAAKAEADKTSLMTQGITDRLGLLRLEQAQQLSAMDTGVKAQMAAVNEALAERRVSEESAAVERADIEAAAARARADVLKAQLATMMMSETERIGKVTEVNAAIAAAEVAVSDARVARAQWVTTHLKAEYQARQTAEAAALNATLAEINNLSAAQQAMSDLTAADPNSAAVRAADQQVATAQRVYDAQTAFNEQQVADAVEMYSKRLLSDDAYYQKVYDLAATNSANLTALETTRNAADIARLKALTASTRDELEAQQANWRQYFQDTATLAESFGAQWGAIEANIVKGGGDVAKSLKAAAENFTGLTSAKAELAALGATFRGTQAEIDANRKSLVSYGMTLDELREKFPVVAQAAVETAEAMERVAATSFETKLAQINAQALLLGTRFDGTSKSISALEGELDRLAAKAQGDVTPAMAELAARLEDLQRFKGLEDTFKDVFGSITGGISKVIEGLQLGTRSWKDFGTMAMDVLKSVAAEIVNRLLKRALDPLVDRLASVAAAAIYGRTAQQPSTRTLPDGTTVSVGVSSQEVLAQNGMINTGMFNGIPTGLFDPSLWSSMSGVVTGLWGAAGGAGALGPAFTGIGGVDMLLAGGSISEASTAFSAAAGSASALSVGLAGVGAAVAAFSTVMDLANGELEAGIGGLVGGIGGAAIGTYFAPGIGTLIGYALGDLVGSWIGGMFGGGPSEYEAKRLDAADEANAALGNTNTSYRAAALSGDVAQVLAALQGGGGGAAGNSVRTELVLSSSLAGQIGIEGQAIGDQIVAQWSSLTLEQFKMVLEAMKENPALIQNVRGSGDVPYLAGGDAEAIAAQIREGAVALLTAFEAMDTVRDKIHQLAADLAEAAAETLPAALTDRFEASIVNPIAERMINVFKSGLPVEEMQKQLDALQNEMVAFAGVIVLYEDLTNQAAQYAGDLATQTQGSISSIQAMLKMQDRAIADAKKNANKAVGVEEVLGANTALRDAMIAKYNMEMTLVGQITAKIKSFLDGIGAPVTATQTDIAISGLERGTAEDFDALYMALAQMSMIAPTVAERLYAITGGLNLILAAAAAMPDAYTTSAAYMPDSGGTRSIPQQITSDIMAEAAPFLASLAALIATANDALDLAGEVALLQQQTQAIAALARAAEDAVVRWAASAIDAANEAASDQVDDINENYANFEDAVNAIADAEEELAQTRIDAIDKELELTERWLTALNAAGDYVRSLELGANSSLTAVEKLSLVAADVDAAWAPFLAAQTSAAAKALLTAENLNTLIAAEQAYLAEALAQVAEKRDADLAAQRDAHDALVERLNKEHDARADLINKEHDDRIAGLNDQLDILSEQARVADEWRSVIESVGDYLTSLTLGPLAPENPMDQLEAAKANFAAAKAAFEGSPTAEGAADVQDAADALLTIAKDVLTRPSVGYQDLFADVFQTLEDLQGTATTLAGPATSKDIEIQSDLIREQIKQENLNVKALLDKETELFNGYINDADRLNKAQITAINAGAAETSRALTREAINTINAAIALAPVTATQAETQLTVLKEERDTLNTTLIFWRDWRREQLAGAADRKARDLEIVELNRLAQISAIEATRDAEVMAIGIAMRAALKANSERQLAIMGLLTDSQIEQLNVITDNMPVQQFIAQKNKDMAAYLLNIRDDIGNFLDAAMPQGSAQAGMLVPRTANYYLHKGETVTPAGAAAGHAITITINGATDPEATAKAVRREVLNVLRSGAGAVLLNRD